MNIRAPSRPADRCESALEMISLFVPMPSGQDMRESIKLKRLTICHLEACNE